MSDDLGIGAAAFGPDAGLFSVLLCGAVWFMLDSEPRDATWLSDAERDALSREIAGEQKQREAEQPSHVSVWSLLRDPQILLFCLIYFLISLTIYGTTFWLPTIIKKMGHFSEFQVGLFNSVPWIISIVAMYVFAALAARFRHQQAWAAVAFTVVGAGMFASASTGNPVYGFVAVCFAAIGFKAASALFCPIPPGLSRRPHRRGGDCPDRLARQSRRIRGAGGLRHPRATAGSIQGGLSGLAIASLLGAVLVFFARSGPHRREPGGLPSVAR